VEKVVDVAGLYHNPPERAVVLCVDEKSQIEALDRSQPVLPMMPGIPERRTHDYFLHVITSLFAAFNVADGTVISELHMRASGRTGSGPLKARTGSAARSRSVCWPVVSGCWTCQRSWLPGPGSPAPARAVRPTLPTRTRSSWWRCGTKGCASWPPILA